MNLIGNLEGNIDSATIDLYQAEVNDFRLAAEAKHF
jgi:hypothetical protein